MGKVGSVADLIIAGSKLKPSIPGVTPKESIVSSSSEEQIKLIEAEAIENRNHYLSEAHRSGKPWFTCVKKSTQYSEFIMLTRPMAEELLGAIWSISEGNRRVKRMHVEALQRDIESDRWLPTHESIAIDTNGQAGDGQHRINAFLASKKQEVCFYFTFGVLPESKFAIDSGSKRSVGEKMQMVVDRRWGNKTAGFCKAIMRGLDAKLSYTPSEITEFAIQWSEVIDWVMTHIPKAQAEVQAAVGKMYIFYGPALLSDFCDRIKNVRFVDEGDPAKALYLALDRLTRCEDLKKYRLALSAMNSLVNNRKIKVLREVQSDVFEWRHEDGEWLAPKNSWWYRKDA
jgi:hypothetical protein